MACLVTKLVTVTTTTTLTAATTAWTDEDRLLMAHALDLARRGLGRVSPGPLVGCVIVDAAGEVVGPARRPGAAGVRPRHGGADGRPVRAAARRLRLRGTGGGGRRARSRRSAAGRHRRFRQRPGRPMKPQSLVSPRLLLFLNNLLIDGRRRRIFKLRADKNQKEKEKESLHPPNIPAPARTVLQCELSSVPPCLRG